MECWVNAIESKLALRTWENIEADSHHPCGMGVRVSCLPLNANAKRNHGSEGNGTKKKAEQTSGTVHQAEVRMVAESGSTG